MRVLSAFPGDLISPGLSLEHFKNPVIPQNLSAFKILTAKAKMAVILFLEISQINGNLSYFQ